MINYVSFLTAVEATTEHVYPDGSVQTPDLHVNPALDNDVFSWFGQFMHWMATTQVPLPWAYNITYFDGITGGIFLFILGWTLGKLIVGFGNRS